MHCYHRRSVNTCVNTQKLIEHFRFRVMMDRVPCVNRLLSIKLNQYDASVRWLAYAYLCLPVLDKGQFINGSISKDLRLPIFTDTCPCLHGRASHHKQARASGVGRRIAQRPKARGPKPKAQGPWPFAHGASPRAQGIAKEKKDDRPCFSF